MLFSTELFKLDYPDEPTTSAFGKKSNSIFPTNPLMPDLFGGRKPSVILQGENPMDIFTAHRQMFQGSKISGFGNKIRNSHSNRGGQI